MEKPVITKNGHTDDCNKRQAAYKEALAKFEQEHPNYCRVCGGRGGSEYSYDPSPAGVSLSPGYMTEVEVCSECVERGVCPLCTQHTLDENGEKCSNCGWAWNGEDDLPQGAPQEPECNCWYYESVAPAEDTLEQILGGLDYLELEADLHSEDREADAFEAYMDGERPDGGLDDTEAYDDP